jgi:BT1 family protein
MLASFKTLKAAYLPVLVTYFAYGASGITSLAALYFQKDTLGITPAEAAAIAFWVGLPWSMKMVVGVASDVYPILGSRRKAYLLVGALCSLVGYLYLATGVSSKTAYLAAVVLVAVGFMIQDVVADALSVEVAQTDEEIGHIQTLGRISLLVGTISVGYASGVLTGFLGPRPVFLLGALLPIMVALAALFVRPSERGVAKRAPAGREEGPLGGGRARLVLIGGLAYAAFSVGLEALAVPFAQEIVLAVSGALIVLLLLRIGLSRAVAVSAFVIFLYRAVPSVGQGYTYWAIDRLKFDAEFLGLLAQVSSVLSLVGLVLFRKPIASRPVSFTITWVSVASFILYLPSIGLYYGVNEWLGLSPRTFAFIDTTISAPLGQLAMVPMLVLIARTAPAGAEATMFAIMASLMNLALSASELFTRYLNTTFAVTQESYEGLGRLMITVGFLGLVPLLAVPLLRREEARPAVSSVPAPEEPRAQSPSNAL